MSLLLFICDSDVGGSSFSSIKSVISSDRAEICVMALSTRAASI
ncbi:hypothetical protein MNBD_GAMMA22-2909 [hydrothermal vent metagenome]|uniref:Uncharacterized protein n=1 Tax=hydrothermal vent metagenome TaxID=652676 RepID=A0A3B1B3V9_9ZZZZ